MPRKVERALTPRRVQTINTPGLLCDGGGLYLQVSPAKDGRGVNKSWLFRFSAAGKARAMGLGSVGVLSLSEARDKARVLRQQRLDGVDPIDARRQSRAALAPSMTFDRAAVLYIAEHEGIWRSEVHRRQWRQSLRDHASPVIGRLNVGAIETADVCKVLDSLWSKVPGTAAKLRGRIESILDWARVRGYRSGENPARWRGHLDHIYPSARKARTSARAQAGKGDHHSALPYADVPAFMAELRQRDGAAARALEFAILTSGRTGEARDTRWDEIDLAAKLWTVPANRMKAAVEHRVPLSDRAVAILTEQAAIREGDFVFAGMQAGKPLGAVAMFRTLKTLRDGVTVHGFRSAFRDWAAECTNFPNEVCEAALAHVIENKVEAAYRRSDLFDKRRRLMDAWAAFCAEPRTKAAVIPLRA
jgi:integrase